MKKYLAIILGMLFVLGFAASAFAIHAEIPSETQAVVAKGTTQLTLGGELRMRGWYADNLSAGTRRGESTPYDSASQAWYDARVRLRLQADVSKNTMGVVHLETANAGSRTSDGYTWGSLNQKAGDAGTALTILEAWIQHKGSGLLGIPAGIKVGHMPLALGEKQFLDHTKFGDDAIVFLMDPTKELHIGLITAKFVEGSGPVAAHSNDVDGYVALVTYKLDKDNTIGVNYAYVNNQTVADHRFQNLGLHAAGKVSGISYKAEFDTQFGTYTTGSKYKGNGLMLGLAYKVNPVNIRAEFARGSGDDDATSGSSIKEFQTTMGNDVHYTFIYEYTTRTASRGNTAQGQNIDGRGRATGIANTTYYRLGLDWSPVKDLSASIDGFILKATKALTAGSSKNIGTEVDVKLTYRIDKNLVYFITAGMLDPKKFWEENGINISSANNKTITQAVHGITLSF